MSMVSSLTLLYIHMQLTEIMCNDTYFGRISAVFFADFLQLPHVKGNHPFIPVTFLEVKQRLGVTASLDLWKMFTYDELTINMRLNANRVCRYKNWKSHRIRIQTANKEVDYTRPACYSG